MGMESVYKLSVVLGMIDNMTGPMKNAGTAIDDMQQEMNHAGGTAIQVSGQMDTVEKNVRRMQETFQAAGQKITAAGDKMQEVGGKLTNAITKPALGAVTALGSIALVKGFNRLTGIDDAKAKLKGLGHDAESVAKIMESALESVRGTSYGMDDAATTAAGAVAAGVEKGKDLTRYLSLTADAAAIAGASMSDMGAIINKVQTSGKAYTENLNQLADRGIPIYQWIAAEAGVTAEEVSNMASKGKISSEMFLSAIENNIGGAAKTMGESSFKASLANIGASISRIGANFLDAGGQGGGFFSTLKPMLTDFNEKLVVLEEKAKEFGVKFGDAFNLVIEKMKKGKEMFDGLSPPMKDLIIKGVGIGAAIAVGIGPALTAAGGLVSGFGKLISAVSFLMSPIGLVIGIILVLAGAFAYLMIKNETFREKVHGAWNGIRDKLSGIISILKPKLASMFDGAQEGLEKIRPKIERALGVIVSLIQSGMEKVKPIFSAVFETLAPLVSTFAEAFSG